MNNLQFRQTRFSIIYVLGAFLLVWIVKGIILDPLLTRQQEVPYSQFRSELAQGMISEVTIGERIVYVLTEEAEPADEEEASREDAFGLITSGAEGDRVIRNAVPVEDPGLVDDLLAQDVEFSADPPSGGLLSG